jgi:chemotaxis protein methyltransferase CheR
MILKRRSLAVSKEQTFDAIRRLVAARTGLELYRDREDALWFAIGREMERAGIDSLNLFYERVNTDERSLEEFIEALRVGETYFFREPSQFAFLRAEVLPEIRSRQGRHRRIRAWCAACSTGEEAYSLAMLFQDEGIGNYAEILATDLSERALAHARVGSYGDWSLRDQGEDLSQNHLTRTGRRRVVSDRVRNLVRFERLNLACEDYSSLAPGVRDFDLILCRNVLIYFDRDTIDRVACRLHAALNEGGWLVTASTDPPLSTAAPFATVVTGQGVFYRRTATCEARSPVYLFADSYRNAPNDQAILPIRVATGITGDGEIEEKSRSGVSSEGPAPKASSGREHGGSLGSNVVTRIRSLAEVDGEQARRVWEQAIKQCPLSDELYYLGGMILLSLGRIDEAARAIRSSLFINHSKPEPHFLLAMILERCNDKEGAARATRNARDLSACRRAGDRPKHSERKASALLGAAAKPVPLGSNEDS